MENKNKSTILHDALALFAITLISGLLLGGVYQLTKPTIDANKLAAKTAAYRTVYSEANDFVENDGLKASVEDSSNILANGNINGAKIDEAFQAVDADGNAIGYVLSTTASGGYGGDITISIGVTLDGSVTGIEFLTLNETAGFGLRAAEPVFKDQYVGKVVDSFAVTKTGAENDNEINAISGATRTSNTVTNAVNASIYFVKALGGNEENKIDPKTAIYKSVFSEASSLVESDDLKAFVKDSSYILENGNISHVEINEAFQAVDEDGNAIGYVLSARSIKGFGGEIKIAIGVTLDGSVTGIEFLTLNETYGLGQRAAEPEFKDQYVDKEVDSFEVTKTGAKNDNEINVISGATMTSDAVTDIVNASIYFVKTLGGN